jgi:hypothetical protein
VLAAAAILVAGICVVVALRHGQTPAGAPPRDTRAAPSPAARSTDGHPAAQPAGGIAGCVVSCADGAGVADIPVTVTRAGGSRQVLTATGGRFAVPDLAPGDDYVLHVFGPEGQFVEVRTRGGEQDVEIRLP